MTARALAGGAGLAALSALLFFQGLGSSALWDPDEARHAEVAREMLVGRGLRAVFLPTLEFEPYREKPAPFYWLVALAYRMGGVGEAAARTPSALAALATVLMVYAYAVRRVGVEGALGAALVLATCVGWFGLARFVNLDMTLTACITAGVLTGLAWLEGPRRRPPLAPWVAAALATLVKGPVGAALIAGPLALAALTGTPRPSWREAGLVRGVLVAAALVAAVWIPVGVLDARYVEAFTLTNLRRLGTRSPHAAPIYYYLLWVPVLALPWTPFAVHALAGAARDPARRPLVLWAAFVPAFLSLARGKLATYALSTLVPLALAAGPELARIARAGPRAEETTALRLGGWLAAALLGAVAIAVPIAYRHLPLSVAGAAACTAVALGWAAVLGATLRRRLALVPAAVLGAMLTLAPLLVRVVGPAASAIASDREAAHMIARAGGGTVIAFARRAPSLVFYLQTPLVHTEDPAQAAALFALDAPVFLLAGHRHVARIEATLGARAHLWRATARRRLYANRPPPEAVRRNGSE